MAPPPSAHELFSHVPQVLYLSLPQSPSCDSFFVSSSFDYQAALSYAFTYVFGNRLPKTVAEIGISLNHAFLQLSMPRTTKYIVDIDYHLLTYAHDLFAKEDHVFFLQADVHHLPFRSSSLEVLLVQNCPSLFVEMLPEALRVLKPGGYAMSVNHSDYLHYRWTDFYFLVRQQPWNMFSIEDKDHHAMILYGKKMR